MLTQPVRVQPLDGLDDCSVERPPPVPEQALVGYLVGQRVLERVLEIREKARLIEELRRLEAAETAAQLVLAAFGDGREERERYVLAHDRR